MIYKTDFVDHNVHNDIVFPGAGYLMFLNKSMKNIHFLQLLIISTDHDFDTIVSNHFSYEHLDNISFDLPVFNKENIFINKAGYFYLITFILFYTYGNIKQNRPGYWCMASAILAPILLFV